MDAGQIIRSIAYAVLAMWATLTAIGAQDALSVAITIGIAILCAYGLTKEYRTYHDS